MKKILKKNLLKMLDKFFLLWYNKGTKQERGK